MVDISLSYTRKQALEDGEQFRLDDKLTLKAGFNWPVFISGQIFGIIKWAEANKKNLNDFNGMVWDILKSLQYQIENSSINGSILRFTVKIHGVGRRQNFDFVAKIGPVDIDDPRATITIMLPMEA